MRRRGFLAAAGMALVGGCLGDGDGDDTTTTATAEPTAAATSTSSTATATRQPTTNVSTSTVEATTAPPSGGLVTPAMGDWFQSGHIALAMTGVTFDGEVRDTFNYRTLEMPDGWQFAFVEFRIKNVSSEPQPAPGGLGAVAGGETHSYTGAFDHPDADRPVKVDWLKYGEGRDRSLYPGGGDGLTLGQGNQYLRFWYGLPVPTEGTVKPAYDLEGGPSLEVRWQP